METNNESNNIKNLLMPENEFINMCNKVAIPAEEIEKYKKAKK